MKDPITVQTIVNAPTKTVWEYWSTPEHIMQWNTASEDWHTTNATVDLQDGGTFTSRMEAKDGSVGFDFGGTYTTVRAPEYLAYTLDDGRKVTVEFIENEGSTTVVETFEPESENTLELQQQGWQAILDNFKQYVETHR